MTPTSRQPLPARLQLRQSGFVGAALLPSAPRPAALGGDTDTTLLPALQLPVPVGVAPRLIPATQSAVAVVAPPGPTIIDATWTEVPERLLGQSSLDALIRWAETSRANDLTIESGRPIQGKIFGRYRPITRRPLDDSEVRGLLEVIYRGNANTLLLDGSSIRTSYVVLLDPATRQTLRNRATIMSCRTPAGQGTSIVIRLLPRTVPHVYNDLGLEPDIVRGFDFKYGMGIFGGKTESGKTTALAAMMRQSMTAPGFDRKIMHFGRPIEFTFADIAPSAAITQVEVPTDIATFALAMETAMSSTPDLIVIEEVNNKDTMSAMNEAVSTGHAVVGSLHITSIAATPQRISSFYNDPNEQIRRVYEAFEEMQIIVVQRLERAVRGGDPAKPDGRVGMREWLKFDQSLRGQLLRAPPHEWPEMLRKMVREHGQTMEASARKLFEAGRITKHSFAAIQEGRLL